MPDSDLRKTDFNKSFKKISNFILFPSQVDTETTFDRRGCIHSLVLGKSDYFTLHCNCRVFENIYKIYAKYKWRDVC